MLHVSASRGVGSDQYVRELPELCWRRTCEFSFVDVQCCTSNPALLQSRGERLLINEFATRDVNEVGARLHPLQFGFANELVGFRGPLRAHHDKIALLQHGRQRRRRQEFIDPLRLTLDSCSRSPCGQHAHPYSLCQTGYCAANTTQAHDADRLPLQENGTILPALERSSRLIPKRLRQGLGEEEHRCQDIFCDRQRIVMSARGRDHHLTAPDVSHTEI